MFHFLDTGRHLGFRTAVDDNGTFGSQAACGAHGIHCRISASYHYDTLAERHRRIRILACRIHQVDTGEVFVRRHDVDRVLSGNVHEVGKSRSRSHEDTFVSLCLQVFHRNGLAHDAVFHKRYAHLRQVVNLDIHNLVGQTEFGNTVFQYATDFVQCFEYRHIITQFSHIARKRQSGRTRTYYRYLDAVLFGYLRHGNVSAIPFVICRETFQITDSHGFVTHFQVNALRFALLLLRTHTPAYSRKRAGLLQHPCRFEELAPLDVLDESRNVNAYGAAFHTRRIGAIQATFGFGQCLLFVQTEVYLFFPAVRTVFGV